MMKTEEVQRAGSKTIELAALCEEAEGPDKDLDYLIAGLVGAKPEGFAQAKGKHWTVWPSYTSSLDAAMTLVPNGIKVTTQNFGGPGPMALVGANERFVSAATLPLAICAAALRARAGELR